MKKAIINRYYRAIPRDIDHDSTTLFRKKGLSGIYRSILGAATEGGSPGKGCGKSAEEVRQVILFANGVLVFECSCPGMSIRLLIKIKETAYLVERLA
ncbi:hypothetical protein ALC62_11748 [Cyphomyrmex costatus]|uniref:Uncharacterized protein n=1 Tax=Cyphomyrmex costatus TaxID=456900 RepID=A0A195CB80_9HYME|nr:hypothetical protein ALC62_11748 [Cyphomyrmex costatus]